MKINQCLQELEKLAEKKEVSVENARHIKDQVRDKLEQLNKFNDRIKSSHENQLLATCLKILQKLSMELLEAKEKYSGLDKDSLKQQKCLRYATELNFYREECGVMSSILSETEAKLRRMNQKNKCLEEEIQSMKQCDLKKQRQRSLIKRSLSNTLRSPEDDKTNYFFLMPNASSDKYENVKPTTGKSSISRLKSVIDSKARPSRLKDCRKKGAHHSILNICNL